MSAVEKPLFSTEFPTLVRTSGCWRERRLESANPPF
jgi:hypothetical protein